MNIIFDYYHDRKLLKVTAYEDKVIYYFNYRFHLHLNYKRT